MKKEISVSIEVDERQTSCCDYNCEYLIPDESDNMICSLFAKCDVETEKGVYNRCRDCLMATLETESYPHLPHHVDGVTSDPRHADHADGVNSGTAVIPQVSNVYMWTTPNVAWTGVTNSLHTHTINFPVTDAPHGFMPILHKLQTLQPHQIKDIDMTIDNDPPLMYRYGIFQTVTVKITYVE